jgi:hypothetical protein
MPRKKKVDKKDEQEQNLLNEINDNGDGYLSSNEENMEPEKNIKEKRPKRKYRKKTPKNKKSKNTKKTSPYKATSLNMAKQFEENKNKKQMLDIFNKNKNYNTLGTNKILTQLNKLNKLKTENNENSNETLQPRIVNFREIYNSPTTLSKIILRKTPRRKKALKKKKTLKNCAYKNLLRKLKQIKQIKNGYESDNEDNLNNDSYTDHNVKNNYKQTKMVYSSTNVNGHKTENGHYMINNSKNPYIINGVIKNGKKLELYVPKT